MIKTLLARLQQGYRTIPFPSDKIKLPDRFMGRPQVNFSACHGGDCSKCRQVCPTGAIDFDKERLSLDLGKCVFCGGCQSICQKGCISFTKDYCLSVSRRQDLKITGETLERVKFDERIKKIFGRSFKLRQVSAGGCNACELDTNVLNTLSFDLSRFGIQFTASPRHADGILVTGPVTGNMKLALEKTYQAVPSPKLVIAVGSCAIAGGPYIGHKEVNNGVDSLFPVDLYIPGCPPNPWTILDGLLRLIGRIH